MRMQTPKPNEVAAVVGAVIGVVGVQVFKIHILSLAFLLMVVISAVAGWVAALLTKRFTKDNSN